MKYYFCEITEETLGLEFTSKFLCKVYPSQTEEEVIHFIWSNFRGEDLPIPAEGNVIYTDVVSIHYPNFTQIDEEDDYLVMSRFLSTLSKPLPENLGDLGLVLS